MKAVDFIVDEVNIGTMGHSEVLALIDLIDHLDIANYSLTAGIIDELETMNGKFDQMQIQMDRIERLLQTQPKPTQESCSTPMFNWQPNGYGAL